MWPEWPTDESISAKPIKYSVAGKIAAFSAKARLRNAFVSHLCSWTAKFSPIEIPTKRIKIHPVRGRRSRLQEIDPMMKSRWTGLLLASTLTFGASAIAQTAGQDMKNAGTDTKDAAKSAGSGVKKGTKKAYHKTKSGTKKAYHKTGKGAEKVGDKMQGKPDPR